jgi:hypothetical protein
MIFKQIDEILSGRKTQTRRLWKDEAAWIVGRADNGKLSYSQVVHPSGRTRYERDKTYAIVPKRGAKGIGQRIRIVQIRREHVQDITEADAKAEGVNSVEEYKALWESINGKTKGARWSDNPAVWALTFEVVK